MPSHRVASAAIAAVAWLITLQVCAASGLRSTGHGAGDLLTHAGAPDVMTLGSGGLSRADAKLAGVVDCKPYLGSVPVTELRDNASPILVMTYNRPTALEKLLARLSSLNGAKFSPIIVAQSPGTPDNPLDDAVVGEIDRVIVTARRAGAFAAVHSMKTPQLKASVKVGTDRKQHGSKQSAANNLLHGLRYTFQTFPSARTVIVLEDDAVVACDLLEMFAAAQGLLLQPLPPAPGGDLLQQAHEQVHRLVMNSTSPDEHASSLGIVGGGRDKPAMMATALLAFRSGIMTGHNDMKLRDLVVTPLPQTLHRLKVVPRTVFKTFAWQISRGGYEVVEPRMAEMVAWSDPSSLWPGFDGCDFCENFCYDHLLEFVFRGEYYVGPDIARVTQLPGEGMTYTNNPVNPVYDGFVLRSEFNATTGYRFLEWFPGSGLSTIINAGNGMKLAAHITKTFAKEPVVLPIVLFILVIIVVTIIVRRRNASPVKARSD